jgi:DNA-binding CsgD family transcriptional regulator
MYPSPESCEVQAARGQRREMDDIIYNDCPRHSNRDFKRLDQRDRYDQNLCVYCARPRSADLLGPAGKECQAKRWAEVKLTARREQVFQGIFQGKTYGQIAAEMGISEGRVKKHSRTIADELCVPYRRTFLVRCFCERQEHLKGQAAHALPTRQNPSSRKSLSKSGRLQKRTSPK